MAEVEVVSDANSGERENGPGAYMHTTNRRLAEDPEIITVAQLPGKHELVDWPVQ
jgi:hypothetical protein